MPSGPSFHSRFVKVSKMIIFSIFNFLDGHWPIKGPGVSISWQDNKAACPRTAWATRDLQGHLCSLLPLAMSLGTGESPVLVALETFTISCPCHIIQSLWEVQAVVPTLCQGHEYYPFTCERWGTYMTLWSLETHHRFGFLRVRWPLSPRALAGCAECVLDWTAPLKGLNKESTSVCTLLFPSRHPTLPTCDYTILILFCFYAILCQCPDGSAAYQQDVWTTCVLAPQCCDQTTTPEMSWQWVCARRPTRVAM